MTAPRPIRIQRKRTPGWKMPANTVSVTRPGPFGNPFGVRECAQMLGLTDPHARWQVVEWFKDWMAKSNDSEDLDPFGHYGDTRAAHERIHRDLHKLRGKNLACFCELDQPCHADVLLELANS